MNASDQSVTNPSEQYMYAKEKYVLDKATKIQIEQGRTWSYEDFKEIQYGYWKNLIWALKKQNKIETITKPKRDPKTGEPIQIRSKPAFYRVKGVDLTGKHDLVTNDRMGVRINSLIDKLSSLTYGPLMIHDIRILSHAYGLHASLASQGYPLQEHSKDITLKEFKLSNNRTAKVVVHNNDKFTVIIACSPEPLIRNEYDTFYLFAILGEIKKEIEHISRAELPPVNLWQLRQCHLNRDANTEFSDKTFCYTIETVAGAIIRIYNKQREDGKLRPRVERIDNSHKSLEDFAAEVLTNNAV